MLDRPEDQRRIAGLTRRRLLRLGALGLTLPHALALRAGASAGAAGSSRRGFGRAKSCIVLFAWGGMSHIDTFDPKPNAGSDVRGLFRPIKTSAPGVHVSEHLPQLAKRMHHMAVVRSAHHNAPSHRSGAYWNLTGHEPPNLTGNWQRSRQDWPSIGSMVAHAEAAGARRTVHDDDADPQSELMPGSICLPYPIYDGGWANGQHAGFLGLGYDPVIVRPKDGKLYDGKSPESGWLDFKPVAGVTTGRLSDRRGLRDRLGKAGPDALPAGATEGVTRYHEQAMDMLLSPTVHDAFDLSKEPEAKRRAYGDHICGRSVLLARRLTEAGVPLVTVYCAAGDLNGSKGAHFDTHNNNFNRLKNEMLPPLDLASAALLDDLAASGKLDETLVVWLTEFGRTPKINGGAGRDHYPNCYSVAFAGAGVQGGQVYGSSTKTGAEPATKPCGPPDLHATIFHALGIDPHHHVVDLAGRPHKLADGEALALF